MSKHNIKKEDKIILFCRSGKRADIALTNLKIAGYKDVTNIGGFEDAKTVLKK
jgi:phage shock protein E